MSGTDELDQPIPPEVLAQIVKILGFDPFEDETPVEDQTADIDFD